MGPKDNHEDRTKLEEFKIQGQDGLAAVLSTGTEAARQFIEELKIPTGATETMVGTILGCLTVRAFTKAWPRLDTPVRALGYTVGGFALYRLAMAALEKNNSGTDPGFGKSIETK